MTDAISGDVDTVVFDVGNVLIDWNPRHLFRKLLPDDAAVERFLAEVCPQSWNVEQDRGRSWAEGVAEAIARHPDQADLIRAYDARWPETVSGPIERSVTAMRRLKSAGVRVLGITNYSAEKWAISQERFDFLNDFDGVVVSAHEGLIKPDPAIFELCFTRYAVDPARAVFIDDSPANCAASEACGMRAIQFTGATDPIAALAALGLPMAR